MALEAVYSQDTFSYNYKDYYPLSCDHLCVPQDDYKAPVQILDNNNSTLEQQGFHASWDSSSTSLMQHAKQWGDPNSSPEACTIDNQSLLFPAMEAQPVVTTGRRKRRHTKSTKNKEEIENQRMTHIAVERNRRKQMNEYLAMLRSLMPPSYVQRGDQASIIGGAINFVKELEQLLQTMEAHKRTKQQQQQQPDVNGFSSPFAEFFTFPQYSTSATQSKMAMAPDESSAAENQWAMADIEVTMVESHANLKILSKRRNRQLLKLVAGLQSLWLTVLHLNVTTIDQMVLYSVSVKIEEGCQLNTVDEIAATVNQMLQRIDEESTFS